MKKNSSRKRKILYSVTAAALFELLLVLFFPGDREYQRIPYDVVFLGDSVYGLCRDETSIAAKLQEKTGLKCYNGGLGGTVLGRADAERRLGYTKDSISAAGLVLGIMAKLEEDKFYLFAWIGIVLNALTLLGIGGIVAVGVYGL